MTTEGVPVQVVGAAIVDSLERPERLLAARRSAPPALAGLWEFPGGKVEPGEGHEAALCREIAEELGVLVKLGEEIAGPGPDGWPLHAKAAMRVWFAEIVDGEAVPLEDHDELRWVPLGDREGLRELSWIPADFPIVEAVRAAADRLAARRV